MLIRARPLEGRYGVTVATAVLSLVPFIITNSAFLLFSKDVELAIGANHTSVQIISALSTAAYAFGALMAGDVIHRYPQPELFFVCEAVFAVGCATAALAHGLLSFGISNILQGGSTGLLLVVALPPVVRRFPPEKLPVTSASINMGLFGAITAGPIVGGVVAEAHVWRLYYAVLAAVAVSILVLAVLSLPHQDPQKPDMPFDWHAVLLGLGATVLPFYAAGALAGKGFASFHFTVPLGLGLISFVALLLTQFHKKEPLSPVKPMWNTLPLLGTFVAMAGGAVFMTLLELALRVTSEVEHSAALHSGLAFWPLLPGVIVGATLLGALVRTRWLPLLILGGMLCLIGAGVLLRLVEAHSIKIIAPVAALLGVGAGSTVSPALWIAGFSLPSALLGRLFALIELVRSVANFVLGPVILEVAHIAAAQQSLTRHAIAAGADYATLIAIASTAFCVIVYISGGAGFPQPDLYAWLRENKPALPSPALAQSLRRRDQPVRRVA